jgi:mRNA interferase MazF
MVVNQGDVYWIDLGEPVGSGPGYRHPHVILQNNLFNHSQINTAVVCTLTSNLKRAAVPGNVSLEKGEANLPRPSVAVVSQIFTVDKAQLQEYVGSLTPKHLRQIWDGLRLITEPRESPR